MVTVSSIPAPLTNGQLALVTIARLAVTTAFRIIYPLQPFLTESLHVDLTTVSTLITVQLLASLIGPVGGTMADLRGERSVMSVGLALFCVGALACAMSNTFIAFLFGYALIGLGVALYQPAASAYISARTPYTRRAWALGIFEISWAGAALLGVAPLMLVVQYTHAVTLVYWSLFIAGVASLILILRALPPTPRQHSHTTGQRFQWNILRSTSVVAAISLMSLAMFAYDLYGVSQGAWLKQAFGANEAMLGQAVGMAGIAELLGSLAVVAFVDRIGKKRAAIGGFIAAAICLALFPLTTGNWPLFLGLVFLFFLAEEFAVVSAIPLISGVAPMARGTVLALTVTITSLTRAVGSIASAPVWQSAGIVANALGASALTCIAVLVCWRFVREVEADSSNSESPGHHLNNFVDAGD